MSSNGADVPRGELEHVSVLLEFARLDKIADPFAFSFTCQRYSLRRLGGGYDAFEIPWSEGLLEELRLVADPARPPSLIQKVGERLASAIRSTVWREHESTIARAVAQGQLVTVTIRSAAAELYALPWELMTLRTSGQRIGGLPGVLLRYAWPESDVVPAAEMIQERKERVLFAWSAAGGQVPADGHADALVGADELAKVDAFNRADTLGHASLKAIDARLASASESGQPYTILHLLCHGERLDGVVGLALDPSDGQGGVDVVDPSRLQQVLGEHAECLRAIVLMACASGHSSAPGDTLGGSAQMLHRAGFEAVLASRFPLPIDASVRFAQAFYAAYFASTASIGSAFIAARSALQRERDDITWASLQLFAREDAAGGSLVHARALDKTAIGPGSELADGRYVLLQQVGESGMTNQWIARDVELRRSVVIKLLRPVYARDPAAVARMSAGARHLVAIEHPRLAHVYDPSGTSGPHRFIVTEFIRGAGDLRTAVLEGRVGPAHVVRIIVALSDGLHALHDRGLAHNILDPSNVLITSDGEPTLVDFDDVAPSPAEKDIRGLARLALFVLSGRDFPGSVEPASQELASLPCTDAAREVLRTAAWPAQTPRFTSAGRFAAALRDAWEERGEAPVVIEPRITEPTPGSPVPVQTVPAERSTGRVMLAIWLLLGSAVLILALLIWLGWEPDDHVDASPTLPPAVVALPPSAPVASTEGSGGSTGTSETSETSETSGTSGTSGTSEEAVVSGKKKKPRRPTKAPTKAPDKVDDPKPTPTETPKKISEDQPVTPKPSAARIMNCEVTALDGDFPPIGSDIRPAMLRMDRAWSKCFDAPKISTDLTLVTYLVTAVGRSYTSIKVKRQDGAGSTPDPCVLKVLGAIRELPRLSDGQTGVMTVTCRPSGKTL